MAQARQRLGAEDTSLRRGVAALAVRWYRKHGRSFFWRQEATAWQVLVAAVLLKRTPAQRVERICPILFERFPTAEALAAANVDTVRRIIAPLGLISRAEQLVAMAEKVAGKPIERFGVEELTSLPGVGAYAAAAVRCFAPSAL